MTEQKLIASAQDEIKTIEKKLHAEKLDWKERAKISKPIYSLIEKAKEIESTPTLINFLLDLCCSDSDLATYHTTPGIRSRTISTLRHLDPIVITNELKKRLESEEASKEGLDILTQIAMNATTRYRKYLAEKDILEKDRRKQLTKLFGLADTVNTSGITDMVVTILQTDENEYTRARAAMILGSVASDTEKVIPILKKALKDESHWVVNDAHNALDTIHSYL